jgi:mannose-6-phosphate isomerase
MREIKRYVREDAKARSFLRWKWLIIFRDDGRAWQYEMLSCRIGGHFLQDFKICKILKMGVNLWSHWLIIFWDYDFLVADFFHSCKLWRMSVIVFEGLPMERVWGGRMLHTVYGRTLPKDGVPYGESWEVVDRADEQSVVTNGMYAGMTLHELWTKHRVEIFGADLPDSERFPLLVKLLDARDDLSIQVHPPLHRAAELGGEPKTEMWYIADAEPGAKLYVGLRKGVDRAAFEKSILDGTVATQVHEISVQAGDSIFIPSGRLHAIGAGLLIVEIQQNSDTTYRVFDWNRVGLDGQPRELHVEQSLASIDFRDIEPQIERDAGFVLATCEFFVVEKFTLAHKTQIGHAKAGRFSMLHVVEGAVVDADGKNWPKGTTILLPCGAGFVEAVDAAVVLRTHIP